MGSIVTRPKRKPRIPRQTNARSVIGGRDELNGLEGIKEVLNGMTAFQREVLARLDTIQRTVDILHSESHQEGELITMAWADVKKEVQETKDASQAIMTVLDSVRVQLRELIERNKDGEVVPVAELQAVHDDLDKNEKDMVAKVLEGTPADPTPEEEHAKGM